MTVEVLQELVASLSGRNKAEITASTSLTGVLQGSLGRVRLEAALRHRLGVTSARVNQATTFGDLCRMLSAEGQDGLAEEAAPAQEAALATSAGVPNGATHNGVQAGGGMQVGIDVQDLAALPDATDFWEHEFYKSTFSHNEIAYALLQPSPRSTFTGQWCAKEALRKAIPGLAQIALTATEVTHDAAGKPEMLIDGKQAGGTLSISHTGDVAVAVYVAAPAPAPAMAVREDAPAQTGGRGGWLFALVALLIAVAALVIALVR